MVTDKQVLKLFQKLAEGKTLAQAARRSNMDEKTARKYRQLGKRPSEVAPVHAWRTRPNPFQDVWPEVCELLEVNPGLQAKTIFKDLQRRFPGRFADSQLRTLQRHIRRWRATSGPPKEVFFSQVHEPGRLCASDFTSMNALNITIEGQRFDHLVYHFVLTYSNWEAATICFSESFESLSEGLQNALWELGGVPQRHRSDRMSTAVNNLSEEKEFTQRYQSLLSHFGMAGEKIQADHANENGDVEQRHRRFKEAMDQALMLRGSRDFTNRAAYAQFLKELLQQLNAGRRDRLAEELKVLRRLPARRLEACKRIPAARVDSGSTIHVGRNTYSVPSRLIGERVEVRVYMEEIEVWYAQQLVERQPRLRGRDKQRINYRHIIDWLVRKPGAFAKYRYRQELFPSSQFRMAYDALVQQGTAADREYLQILHLAAQQSESAVEEALRHLLKEGRAVSAAAVTTLLCVGSSWSPLTEGSVAAVDLRSFDELLTDWEVGVSNDKEVSDAWGTGCQEEAGGVAAGTAPADDPERLRGAGPAGGEGVAELRAVPAGGVRAREPGTTDEADRAFAASVVPAAGEEPGDVRSEAFAGEAGAAGAKPASWRRGRAQGEPPGLWQSGLWENASVVWACPGAGSSGTACVVHDVDVAGARVAGGEARSETEPGAETAVASRRAVHRRPGLRAAKPGGDGSVVHAAGGSLRAWQRLADEQPAVLEMGIDLQGCDDDGGSDRPAGASQRDPGVEHAELSPGGGQEEQGQGGGAGANSGLTGWQGGPARSGCGGLLRSVPAAKAAGHSAPQAPTPVEWTCGNLN